MVRSIYSVVRNDEDFLILQDDSCNFPGQAFKSVTNDIDMIIEDMYADEHLTDEKCFLYYDSEGELTEVKHTIGKLRNFSHPTSQTRFMVENGLGLKDMQNDL